jgi:hypothetical protein
MTIARSINLKNAPSARRISRITASRPRFNPKRDTGETRRPYREIGPACASPEFLSKK